MKYRREIDGLRTFAVLPVILFHAGMDTFSGGYVGVDVFFVISGYLITTILISDLAAGRFSILHFYERRARRILPALFFVIACCVPFAWLWMVPSQFQDFSQALVAVGLFASNVLFWLKVDYFAPAAEENPLLHTWSLAVEEQFYIVFPVLLVVLWPLGRRPMLTSVLVLSVLSLGLAHWGSRHAPAANFFLLPTRAWEMGAGALCAFVLERKLPQANQMLSALGLALIVGSILVFDSETPFPSLYALAPVVGAALIILYATPTTWTGRLLSQPLCVGIGLISYSAYLWHQPLFAFARIRHETGHPPLTWMLPLAMLALALAYLTWRWVEQPFRQRATPMLATRGAVFRASGLAISAVVGLGLVGHVTRGFYETWVWRHPDGKVVIDLIETAKREKGQPIDDGACRFNSINLTPDVADRLQDCHRRLGPATVVLGDSHGIDLFTGFYAMEPKINFLIGLTRGYCRPHTPASDCQYEPLLTYLADHPETVARVIFTQAGFHLLEDPDGKQGRSIIQEIPLSAAIPFDAFRINTAYVDIVSDYLDQVSAYTDVVWVGPRIEPHVPMAELLKRGCDGQFDLRRGQRALYEKLDDTIAAYSAGRHYRYVSQVRTYDFHMHDDFMDCAVTYWSDGDHWSRAGAARFMQRLDSSGVLR